MIAVDTNVLLRYILDDDNRQSIVARRLIDEQCSSDEPAFVHEVVLAEIVWVLGGKKGVKRKEIAQVCRDLLDNAHLSFRDEGGLAAALDAFEDGPADFAEYLVAAQSRTLGAATTCTFDVDAGRSPGFTLL
ncbi:PIN domain-containing protein [Propylenella binzhouense]|uniref:PIN domain-containing protein n=1 Tax=Propylenella binzhouense TaxID=2555902 RepID=A0A964T7E2_9HYPH|nr:type II toxin-antitoxin system VapC family toxin [Propylenella binzhouense]MYZ49794.1 PIN domain-containing protein [Propylenella binzhouense]